MNYKAKVVLMSTEVDGEWFVSRVDYVTEAEQPFEKFEFSTGGLKEGDILKLQTK